MKDKEDSSPKELSSLYSLPEGLVIKQSSIPGAGLGVFATQHFPGKSLDLWIIICDTSRHMHP